MTTEPATAADFESALKALESAVERLESGETDLAESLRLFEEGVANARRCQQLLDEARQVIERIDPAGAATGAAADEANGD